MVQEDIKNWAAIVGMSCRFPHANSTDEYWELLVNGKNTCSTPPTCRARLVDSDFTIKGNFLKCPVDQFDASFFDFSPTEASFTDPQARLLLEVSWEALEDAGINPDNLRGEKVGVFHGSWLQEYKEAMNDKGSPPSQDFLRKYLGNSFGSTAAKISFFYGFTGPNVSTESGCSSSMVTIDMACKSLQRKECTMAIACGANLILQNNIPLVFCAEDGKSKSFDAGANGYARAEGIAVLILKRYSDAILDGDNIHGIIRGVGTSQEGLSKSFGTPTIQSEYDSMREALVNAKVTPTQVDFVEAHATGTAVGDPIEAAAIVKAYHSGSSKREFPLVIGSGKTNLGHTESCSGMAGVIKVLLSMKHGLIPKHINLSRINPQIDFTPIPGIIPLEPVPWPRKSNQRPRIAGVSSFGITGTDVHVILQEPPIVKDIQKENTSGHAQILTISAKSNAALEQMTNQFVTHLETSANDQLFQDITYTANVCRAHHPIRRSIVGSSVFEMVKNARKGCNMYTSTNPTSSPKKICFTFPGRCGRMPLEPIRRLYQTNPCFKNMMDFCNQVFGQVFPEFGPLIDILLQHIKESPNTPKGIDWYCLIISCHYSLAKLWNKWGIFPNLVIGHCLGEFSAAVVCGALNLKNAFEMLKIIPYFLHSQVDEPASMKAINRSKRSVENLIHDFLLNYKITSWIDIAAANSDFQTLVVGLPSVIADFQQYCMQQNIKVKDVPSDFCPHSRAVEIACQKSLEIFNKIMHQPIKIPYISSSTGAMVKNSELNGMFWYRVLRNCVQFEQSCISAINTKSPDIFLEIGLDTSLTNFTKANLKDHQTRFNCLASFPRKEYGIYDTLAEMYALGVDVDWDNFHNSVRRNKVKLPHYPFQRKSFWYEHNSRSTSQINLNRSKIVHSLLGGDMAVPPVFGNFAFFKSDNFLIENKQSNFFIYDHVIGNQVIFPGACFLEMILSCWKLALKLENILNYSVEKFTIHEPLLLDKSSAVTIVSVVNKDSGNVRVYTTSGTGLQWKLHATADLIFDEHVHRHQENFGTNIMPILGYDHKSEERANDFYYNASKVGLNFGPTFKSLKRIYKTKNGDTLAEVKGISMGAESFCCHPILIDAMIQGFMVHTKPTISKLLVPIKINKFVLFPSSSPSVSQNGTLFVHCQKGNTTTVSLVDQTGKIVAVMRSPELVQTTVENILAAAANHSKHQNNNADVPVPNSINLYEVYWKPAKFYQPCPNLQKPNEWITMEYQNELSDLKSKQSVINDFSEEEANLDEKINRLCYLYVVKALLDIGWMPELGLNISKECTPDFNVQEKWGIIPGLVKAFRHFVSYVNENEKHFNETRMEQVEYEIKSILELPIIKEYKAMKTIHECGWNLVGILKGDISPHKILFGQENLAEHYYRTSRFARSHESLEKIFIAFVKKQAAEFGNQHTLKILEVGAGTGVFPKRIIPILKNMGAKFHYHFTDISRTLVSRAKDTFEMISKDFTFKVLNIEMDPLKQGFPAGYFDIVFALDVLHATRNVNQTLRNIQMVTKFGGLLLLGETEKPVREVDICFGGLDGYWLFEDTIRENHCTIESDIWLRIMAENGFSGNPCQILSCGGQISAISAIKTGEKLSQARKSADWIVFDFGNGEFSEYKLFMERMSNRNFHVFSVDPRIRDEQLQSYVSESLQGYFEGVLIWMCPHAGMTYDPVAREILEPLLYISKYLQQAKGKSLPKLHLVTGNCWDFRRPINLTEKNLTGPSLAQAWGFMRNARIELTGILSKSIDLEMSCGVHDHVTQLLTELWLDDRETEVVYRKGTRYVRRLKKQTTKTDPVQISNAKFFNDRSTYLITGGKTGIGFEVCKWMVMEHGAKYVVLVSRSPADENVKQAILDLKNHFGATIICKEVDVSDYNQGKTLIDQDLRDFPPLRGVHHCAAILSDQLLSNQEWPNFECVISPKARGAWNLHQLTMETPLEHFVLYSSAVSVFGHVGQTNYVCASSYLDNLAALRISMGLPALSINWGPWKAGLVENVEVANYMPFSISQGIQALNYFMQSDHDQQNQTVAATVDFTGILKVSPYFQKTLFEDIVISSSVTGQNELDEEVASSVKVDKVSLATQLRQCTHECEKGNVIKTFILELLCETLGTMKEDIKDDVIFTDIGMDSLMSIEFINKLNSAVRENTSGEDADFQREINIQIDLEENGTLQKLTSFLLKALD